VRSIGLPSWIDRLLGAGEQPVPPHAFAVDGDELRGASFRREGESHELRELHAVPMPAGALAGGPLGGPISDADALTRAVAELVRRFAKPPRRASLVLPDLWARALVVELGDLPRRVDLRTEVLRFRLKKLVPFRVDELRVAATAVPHVVGQEDPVRALVLYAADGLCAGLEHAFTAAGVAIGQITNSTLARLTALSRPEEGGLFALAAVEATGFTLVFARGGEPLLWRQKSFADGLDENERAPLLAAELRLTRTFLEDRLGGEPLTSVALAAPRGVEAFWTTVLEQGLEVPVLPIAARDLPHGVASGGIESAAVASLVGAVTRRVA
jgi:type IV pilus assembly protein PilM